MKNPYSHIPEATQKLRALFAINCFGLSLLALNEVSLTTNIQKRSARVVDCFEKCCDSLGREDKNVSPVRLKISGDKFKKLAMPTPGMNRHDRDFHKVAVAYAASLLIWDAIVTCPAICQKRCWKYLDKHGDKLFSQMFKDYPEADIKGTDIYLDLAWEAERREA